MTRAERLFFITAAYGIALHTVTRTAPSWLAVLYAIALTGGALCALVSVPKTGGGAA